MEYRRKAACSGCGELHRRETMARFAESRWLCGRCMAKAAADADRRED